MVGKEPAGAPLTSEPLNAWVVYERVDFVERITTAADGHLRVTKAWENSHEPPDLDECPMLIMEQPEMGSGGVVRAQTFASAGPGLLVIVVPEGASLECELALRHAGAFDVIESGPAFRRGIVRMIAAARQILRLRADHMRLSAGLAHSERLSAIGLLAAGVGHEINNPSTAVLANAERLRAELEALLTRPRLQQADVLQQRAADWLESLGDCIAASRRITSIVRALNVFSRRTDENARPEPTFINDEVATVLRLVGKEVRFQAHVELDLDPGLPYVLAPPHAMTQVVTNLVVNALQALEKKSREERKLTIKTSHDDDIVMFEVLDNGQGIQPDVVARVFDPFFTTKHVGSGSGLGLSISRELVTRSGGEIFVESELGRGACFRVVLPRPERSAPEPRSASWPPMSTARLRVLIVDDDEMLLRAITGSLTEEFECVPLPDARTALDIIEKAERFDVMVCDVVMPDMDGLQLYEKVRERDPSLAERTLFFSGGLQSQALEQALVDTGRTVLGKPTSMRELARKIRRVAAGDHS
jgi:signal transduction histidine kinase